MQDMVYLKAIQKIAPMGVSVSGTSNQKTYLKKFKGASAPLSPPGSAYACRPLTISKGRNKYFIIGEFSN